MLNYSRSISLALLLLLSNQAIGDLVVSSRIDFDNYVTDTTLITFDSSPAQGGNNFVIQGVGFSANGNGSVFVTSGTTNALTQYVHGNGGVIQVNLPSNVFAVGANLGALIPPNVQNPLAAIKAVGINGSVASVSFTPNDINGTFVGFISTEEIIRLEYGRAVADIQLTMDNLIFGRIASVPEPGAAILSISGLLAFVANRRLRSRRVH